MMCHDKSTKHTYIIVDPNEPKVLMNILRQILVGKLLALPQDERSTLA